MKCNTWTWAGVLLATLLCATVSRSDAAGAVPASGGPQQSPTVAEQATGDARSILNAMAQFIARQPRFGVTIRSSYDAVQESGQKIAFDAVRKVTVSRPDGLRVEVEDSDGERRLVVFDGRAITIFDAGYAVYAQADAPGDIDGAVIHLLRDLGGRLPLAMMFLARLPAELERRVEQVDYVERNVVTPVPTHHLAVRARGVDFQVWVADGDAPLPQRVVITYLDAPGMPQFRADFADWNLAPAVAAGTFVFTPPEGAERIPFFVRARNLATPGPGGAPAKQ